MLSAIIACSIARFYLFKEGKKMEEKNTNLKENNATEVTQFDYDNSDWPRDFDIRIEVAEQREIFED